MDRILLTIGQIDQDAFQGRERHPDDHHTGRSGIVIEMRQLNTNGAFADAGVRRASTEPDVLAEMCDDENTTWYLVMLAPTTEHGMGELVEILEHEVAGMELVRG